VPDPVRLGSRGYQRGFLLWGMPQAFLRTGDQRYLDYIGPWADRATGVSPKVWCRAAGGFGIALMSVPERLPSFHARIRRCRRSCNGAWRPLRGTRPGDRALVPGARQADRFRNWTETSCSAMIACSQKSLRLDRLLVTDPLS
jgi:rhamnogalacturonyl hydrolase YesR